MSNGVSFGAAVLAALTLAGAAWAWSGVARARTEAAALDTRLAALRANVAALAALPALPLRPPLARTLSEFLTDAPDGTTVRVAGRLIFPRSSESFSRVPRPMTLR